MLEAIVGLIVVGGLFVGAVILIAQVAGHASRIRMLESQITGLRNLLESLERSIEELTPGHNRERPRPVSPSSDLPRPVPGGSPSRPPAVAKVPASAGIPSQGARPVAPPAPPPRPSRSREEWEALIGGKLLNRIGALALILAVGFFLKYAFDKDWITEIARIGIGALVGILCLLLAERTSRRGFAIFAQGLVGAGIAILYVTIYASFNFYALVSQPVAFGLMFAVTGLALAEAFRYNALAVSLLGLLGGFVTPFLLQTQETNLQGLFIYLLVLDVGLLGVVLRRDNWAVLEPLAFMGTYATYLAWHYAEYNETHLWTCVVFLSAVWLLFHGTDLLRVRRSVAGLADLRRAFAIFYLFVFFIALSNILRPESLEIRALLMLVLAMLYAASAFSVRSVAAPVRSALVHYLTAATLFLFISTTTYFERFTQVIIGSLEALLLIWLGLRIRQKALWVTAMVFLPVLFLMLLGAEGAISFEPLEDYRVLFNERALAFAVLGSTFALAGMAYRKARTSRWISELLHYGWLVMLILVLSLETNDLFRLWSDGVGVLIVDHLAFQRTMVLAGIWALTALPLVGFGLGGSTRPVFYTAVWLLVVASALAVLRAVIYEPIEEYRLLFNMRTAVLLMISSACYGAYATLARSAVEFSYTEEFRSLFRFVPVVAILVLLSTETWDVYRYEALILPSTGQAAALTRLENLQQLSLSSVWLLFSIVLMVLGFWRRDRAFRLQAMGLFGIAILKIFLYDLSFLETLYRIFSFVGLGVILLLVSYLYQRYKDMILSPSLAETAQKEG